MLDKQLRPIKEQVLHPTALWLGERFSPTQITLVGGAIGVAAALAGWQGLYALGLGLWLVNRVVDGFDGTVARLFNKQTDLGGYIDILVDNLVYVLVAILLTLSVPTQMNWLALAFMLGVFYINHASWMFLASILEKRKQGTTAHNEMTSITMPSGLIEGAETVVLYALFFVLPQYLGALFIITAILTIITIAQRLIWAMDNID